MKLILTHYIDASPATVTARLGAAVSAGLDAAAARSATPRRETVTTTLNDGIHDGIHIVAGLDALTGTDCTFTGTDHLTELRVEVPWSPSDSGTTKLWAANRFAGVVAERLTADELTAA